MNRASGPGLGRELFVYWHLAPADLAVAVKGMDAFQHALRLRHEGLQARLLRRCDDPENKATLMETYSIARGIPLPLQTEIVVGGARIAAAWCIGARQVEVFEPLAP